MSSGVEASFGGHLHCFAGALEVVASVDVAEGAVVAGFDAVLYHHYGCGEGIRNRGLGGRSLSLIVWSLSLSKGPLPPWKDTPRRQVSQIVQLLLIDTIRTRADHDPHHLRMAQDLLIKSLQPIQRTVCV